MKPTTELISLVDKSLAQTITHQELARLEDLLADDSSLHYYMELAGVEGRLPLALDAVSEELAAPAGETRRHWLRPLSVAAAAAVTFVAGSLSERWFFSDSSPAVITQQTAPKKSDKSAVITSLIGVSWQGDAPDSLRLSDSSDTIVLKSGLMELTFASGVRTLIEGPASIQVTGNNEAQLNSGRMVADVPKGAEGFTVNYPDGRVVDLGTEFALHVPESQSGAEVGVFRGEVEVYHQDGTEPTKVLENHAVNHRCNAAVPFKSIPFHRKDYVRSLPSREFPWELASTPTTSPELFEFDVSHLVWKSGEYLAAIKWMAGIDALDIQQAQLLLDGEVIATDSHLGRTGRNHVSADNSYTFSIPESKYRKGRWTLQLNLIAYRRGKTEPGEFSPDSSGILLFEDGRAVRSTEKDFLGTWEYRHNGAIHRRTFSADHRVQYSINGRGTNDFKEATWSVTDGILTLLFPARLPTYPEDRTERHFLRNGRELIFVDRPYRNAYKVEK